MLPPQIRAQLNNPRAWFGVHINQEFPTIDRLWIKDEAAPDRLCLHRIHKLPPGIIPTFHQHPWACEAGIIKGAYFMDVGVGPDGPPPVSVRLRLVAGSSYQMLDAMAWHAIEPIDDFVYTFFRISNRWNDRGLDSCRSAVTRLTIEQIGFILSEIIPYC